MDPAQLQPGYRLDRYELLCPLAYGGMASVWLARFGGRLGFERLVVVKMILPQYSQDPRFQEMFLDEARIASRIEHTNVARILDVGEHDENYFIVMEWVDGDSLSKILRGAEQRKQRVPAGVALRICADAASGLHAAHELRDRDGTLLGVVHRDVSPQNILVANTGATMLIDFGVAKARDRVAQETSAGELKGKIRYMAPEQARGAEIDRRADVWAIGAMLYELFSGNPPYDGPNEVATLHKLTSGARPAPLSSKVPAAVRSVVERALAHEPEDRFATALELHLALESAMVEIADVTSLAVVAHYTGTLLADRKGSRKRAVDGALASAHQRDAAGTGAHPLAPRTPPAAISAPSGVSDANVRSTQPILNDHASEMPGALGLSESPSAGSHTLGSAAIEYPPEPVVVDEQRMRRRRYAGAAFLGVSLAVGVTGAALIVSTTVLKREDRIRAAAAAERTAGISAPSVEAASAPIVQESATPSAISVVSASASDAAASAPPAAKPLGSGAPHRVLPPVAKPKPPPVATATAKKPDYGF